MANPPLQSPTNPHFFQPLLPGFNTYLTIPVAFFSKHIEGKNEQKTANLRSDAPDKTWQVAIDGQRFTGGWNDFATAHDLRIGDIIIFKHEGDMVFNVTPFGPSCCEIQYPQSHFIKEEEKDKNDHENENLKPETESKSSFSFDYCFVAQVTASNLKLDTLELPMEAANSSVLNKRFHKMILVNKEGNSWTVRLRFRESSGCFYIRGGWRRFCCDNRRNVGDMVVFNLVGDGKTSPMICICPEEECSEVMSKHMRENKKTKRRPKWVASSSSRENRYVTISLTRYNFRTSKLILPAIFMKINGINRQNEIILMDKHGVKRLTKLVKDGSKYGKRGLGKGWKDFCEANDVLKIGQPFRLELVWEDSVPVLKFCSKVKVETICD
ncbi:B3 domain-containing protein REM6 [Hirschfeldia incana]|nr:B3 domain-containing protein REM6 [Hirschfeldia incana]